jgi:hypothetical protein
MKELISQFYYCEGYCTDPLKMDEVSHALSHIYLH